MSERENLHEGHRERMMKKFAEISTADGIPEHELLEVLLYYAIPRKDTNPLAHRLIRAFGDLENVFSASVKELCAVEGVGERTALFINTVGKIHRLTNEKKRKNKNEEIFSLGKNIWEFADEFKGVSYEKFIIRLYDSRYREITTLVFDSNEAKFISVDISEIVKAIAINKPASVIIAHNHPSGNPEPSKTDDFTTAKLNMVCLLHGAKLTDHIIFTKNGNFSYYGTGRMEFIQKNYTIEKMLSEINYDMDKKGE